MVQRASIPTHQLGGLPDVIITGNSQLPAAVVVEEVGLSDHMLLSLSINISSSPVPQYATISKRVLKKFNINSFQNKILKSTLCTADFANDDSCSSLDVDSMVNDLKP